MLFVAVGYVRSSTSELVLRQGLDGTLVLRTAHNNQHQRQLSLAIPRGL